MMTSQSLLFLFAGFDTVQAMLTWAAFELAKNPDVQDKLISHVLDAVADNDGKLDYSVTQDLPYLDRVAKGTVPYTYTAPKGICR